MRILLLNDAATPSGGAELLTIALRNQLREFGHDARIFSSTASYGPQPTCADYHCFGTTGRLRSVNRVLNASAYLRLRDVLRQFKPDVVHVRMFLTQLSPAILPLLRGVPSLYHAAWYETICPNGLKLLPDNSICHDKAGLACLRHGCLSTHSWPLQMLQLRLWEHWRSVFDVVVANSNAVRNSLVAHGISPVTVIWNGVSVRPARPALSSTPTVAFASRLSREKGPRELVIAFARLVANLPNARLLIAGDGPMRNDLDRLITDLNLCEHVEMLGHLSNHALEQRLEKAWVVAVPSLLAEPFGLAAAESMMRGTAVVATNAGGLAEIVRHESTGLLVRPGDEIDLSAALARILGNRDLAEEWGRSARKYALSHFGLPAFARSFEDLYRSITVDPNRPH